MFTLLFFTAAILPNIDSIDGLIHDLIFYRNFIALE